MSSIKQLNKSLNKVVSENIDTTLETLKTFLIEKKVANIETLLDEFKAAQTPVNVFLTDVKDGGKSKPKKTRTPSQYNLYIRDKMKELKEKDATLSGKNLMLAATKAWREEKAK